MKNLIFKLDAFEGPLDLLLHLISKHKLNIEDIEIAKLLEQYLQYINGMEDINTEGAEDFLEMAARLIYIKTVSLLPKPEEAKALKEELQGRLIEYALCKETAVRLRSMFAGFDIFIRSRTDIKWRPVYKLRHPPEVLRNAYADISKRVKPAGADTQREKIDNIIKRRPAPVITKVVSILRKLYKTGVLEMDMLYTGIYDHSERVAVFLAVLELTKSGRIKISDDDTEIYFKGRNG